MARYSEESDYNYEPSKRDNSNDIVLIALGLLGGFIIAWLVLDWIRKTNIRIPPPDYSCPPTPYFSPYPYSPYNPAMPPNTRNLFANTADDQAWNRMTANNETWDVQRDKDGNLKRINIHRKVREY